MTGEIERRDAVALMMTPFAAALAGNSSAQAASRTPGVSFDVWIQVTNLVQMYADCLDRLDLKALDGVFASDAVFDYRPGAVWTGLKTIQQSFELGLARYKRTIHFMGNPSIRPGAVEGNYSAWTPVMARHEWNDGTRHTVYGRYVDELRPDLTTGALLIARRKLVAQLSEGDVGERYWLDRGA